jgi:hypothetical protein
MTDISKRLEQTLRSAIQKNPILPVKVADGILVGDIKIISQGTVKHIQKQDRIIYKEISLNCAAIRIANLLARRESLLLADQIYQADQEYGRWFADSQHLRSQYEKYKQQSNFDRADTIWARYIESRNRTNSAKKTAEQLASI